MAGDFYARRIVFRGWAPGGEETLLPQFSGLYVKRKNHISGDPLKGLEVFRISGNAKRHKCADRHAAASFDEASRFVSIRSSVNGCPGSSGRTRSWACHNCTVNHASREDQAKCISVFGWSLGRHSDMEPVGQLVELQFRIAA